MDQHSAECFGPEFFLAKSLLPGGPEAYCNGHVWEHHSSVRMPNACTTEHLFHHRSHPEGFRPRSCRICTFELMEAGQKRYGVSLE